MRECPARHSAWSDKECRWFCCRGVGQPPLIEKHCPCSDTPELPLFPPALAFLAISRTPDGGPDHMMGNQPPDVQPCVSREPIPLALMAGPRVSALSA